MAHVQISIMNFINFITEKVVPKTGPDSIAIYLPLYKKQATTDKCLEVYCEAK